MAKHNPSTPGAEHPWRHAAPLRKRSGKIVCDPAKLPDEVRWTENVIYSERQLDLEALFPSRGSFFDA